jgi:hypothetical protein
MFLKYAVSARVRELLRVRIVSANGQKYSFWTQCLAPHTGRPILGHCRCGHRTSLGLFFSFLHPVRCHSAELPDRTRLDLLEYQLFQQIQVHQTNLHSWAGSIRCDSFRVQRRVRVPLIPPRAETDPRSLLQEQYPADLWHFLSLL